MTRTKELSELSNAELLTKLESSVCSAVRYTTIAVRLGEEYQRRMQPNEMLRKQAGAVLAINTGLQNTVSGCGEMFETFSSSGDMNKYTGCSGNPKKYYEDGWQDANFRLMKFDQSFYKMPYDCRKNLAFNEETDVVLKKPRRKRSKKSSTTASNDDNNGGESVHASQSNDDVDSDATIEDDANMPAKKRSSSRKRSRASQSNKEIKTKSASSVKKLCVKLTGKNLQPKPKKTNERLIKTAAAARDELFRDNDDGHENIKKPSSKRTIEVQHKYVNKVESLAEIRQEKERLRINQTVSVEDPSDESST